MILKTTNANEYSKANLPSTNMALSKCAGSYIYFCLCPKTPFVLNVNSSCTFFLNRKRSNIY